MSDANAPLRVIVSQAFSPPWLEEIKTSLKQQDKMGNEEKAAKDFINYANQSKKKALTEVRNLILAEMRAYFHQYIGKHHNDMQLEDHIEIELIVEDPLLKALLQPHHKSKNTLSPEPPLKLFLNGTGFVDPALMMTPTDGDFLAKYDFDGKVKSVPTLEDRRSNRTREIKLDATHNAEYGGFLEGRKKGQKIEVTPKLKKIVGQYQKRLTPTIPELKKKEIDEEKVMEEEVINEEEAASLPSPAHKKTPTTTQTQAMSTGSNASSSGDDTERELSPSHLSNFVDGLEPQTSDSTDVVSSLSPKKTPAFWFRCHAYSIGIVSGVLIGLVLAAILFIILFYQSTLGWSIGIALFFGLAVGSIAGERIYTLVHRVASGQVKSESFFSNLSPGLGQGGFFSPRTSRDINNNPVTPAVMSLQKKSHEKPPAAVGASLFSGEGEH